MLEGERGGKMRESWAVHMLIPIPPPLPPQPLAIPSLFSPQVLNLFLFLLYLILYLCNCRDALRLHTRIMVVLLLGTMEIWTGFGVFVQVRYRGVRY